MSPARRVGVVVLAIVAAVAAQRACATEERIVPSTAPPSPSLERAAEVIGAIISPSAQGASAEPAVAPAASEPVAARDAGALAFAEKILAAYVEATRYPPDSQPMRSHEDLLLPHAVPALTLPLAGTGRTRDDVRVVLRQDRMYLAATEAARLTIECRVGTRTAPCVVLSAFARPLDTPSYTGARTGAPVSFTDDGVDGDERAGDGVVTATLRPAAAGFERFSGSILVDVGLQIGDATGATGFQLTYGAEIPAVFTGRVREGVENGDLALYVELDVRVAGRFEIVARVDDASGRSFAYLDASEVLAPGLREVRLRVFGRLVHDERATAPFRVRDLEGLRLLEDAHPDREVMPERAGVVHTTSAYPPSTFTTGEWESDERSRHIARFRADVERARARASEPGVRYP